jgi:PH domain
VINDTDDEKLALLRRISQLEEELKMLKKKMRKELEAAEQEKESLLSDAEKEKLHLLAEAEASKDQALDKVRMLLAGTQKSGWMFLQEKAILGGTKWKKRFFMLRDNYLCVYKTEDATDKNKRPLGIVDCQAVRLYELQEKEIGRQFVFQVDNKKVQWNIAAAKTEEMRAWMNEIRVAKKKKLGVKVVSEETNEQRRAREIREQVPSSPRTPRSGSEAPAAAATYK